MTGLILLRHGQTVGNVTKRWVGWGETGLTARGKWEAQAVARRLAGWGTPIGALYTSPLGRAVETATTIGRAVGLAPIEHLGLREINFGRVEGLTLAEFEAQFPALYAQWTDKRDMTMTWPGGECRADFFRRVARTADEIVAARPQETVIVVCHGGTLRAVLAHLLGGEYADWWAYALDNCSLTHLTVGEDGDARLITLNDCAHLQEDVAKPVA